MNNSNIISSVSGVTVPEHAVYAFSLSQQLTESDYIPPLLDGDIGADGLPSVYVSGDSKALMFFDYCRKKGLNGRIINDEVQLHLMGEFGLVAAKAYVYIGDMLLGSGAAGQTFKVGNIPEMDCTIQTASGLAKSRALSNAGFGIVSQFKLQPQGGQLPVGSIPAGNPPAPATGSPVQQPAAVPVPVPAQAVQEDPLKLWAKGVFWPREKMTMGELLATNPKRILWAAESMPGNGDVKKAAKLLYREACRLTGVAPKPDIG